MPEYETLSPRETKRVIQIGNRSFVATLREQTVREMNKFRDARVEIDQDTVKGCFDGLGADAVLERRDKLRGQALKSILHFDLGESPTESEIEDIRFSQKQALFALQDELNQESDVMGEAQGPIQWAAARAREISLKQAQSVPEAEKSSDGSGLSVSVTTSESTTI